MKHVKSINEFFGLFKKKREEKKISAAPNNYQDADAEDNQIALEFLKRIEKIKSDNNPYEIKKLDRNETQELQEKGVTMLMPYQTYKISF
jgi:hypothetical protein